MTPVMEDIINTSSRITAPEDVGAVPSISHIRGEASASDPDAQSPEMCAIGGIVTSAFALGQILGPLLGTTLTSHLGFEMASTVMAGALCFLVPLLGWRSSWSCDRPPGTPKTLKYGDHS
jgi:MFS family permease